MDEAAEGDRAGVDDPRAPDISIGFDDPSRRARLLRSPMLLLLLLLSRRRVAAERSSPIAVLAGRGDEAAELALSAENPPVLTLPPCTSLAPMKLPAPCLGEDRFMVNVGLIFVRPREGGSPADGKVGRGWGGGGGYDHAMGTTTTGRMILKQPALVVTQKHREYAIQHRLCVNRNT